ncbi:MAG: hypothetical protein AAF721_40340 [Myxococcota bacterium]
MQSPAPKLSIVADRGRLVMATYGQVFVAGWSDAPTPQTLWDLRAAGQAEEEQRGPMALLNIAFSGRPSFSDDVRRAAQRLTSDASLFQVSRAHVVLIPGLPGTAVRAFINTFILLARPPKPTKMHGTILGAVQWNAKHLGTPQPSESATLAELAVFERRVVDGQAEP